MHSDSLGEDNTDIPILNGVRKAPAVYSPERKQVLVVTNDSTVFQTEKWVSAYEMFGGRLTEVKNLAERLSEKCQVSFGIISGKYGFIPANYVIMKYNEVPSSESEYKEAEERTQYSDKLAYVSQNFFDHIIICVPKGMFSIIKDKLPDKKVIAVTNPEFKEYCEKRGWIYLERKGARVGNANSDKIFEMI